MSPSEALLSGTLIAKFPMTSCFAPSGQGRERADFAGDYRCRPAFFLAFIDMYAGIHTLALILRECLN
jgi:hypothetical protein